MALSGIRRDFSGICTCELQTVEPFRHSRAYVVDHGHNAPQHIVVDSQKVKENALKEHLRQAAPEIIGNAAL
jgi:hypothetical protein